MKIFHTNKLTQFLIAIAALFITQCLLPSHASGPLVVKGGMAITYGTRPFLYRLDKGKIGKFSNSEAVAIVEDLFDDWETLPQSDVNFQRDNPAFLDFDVNATNFEQILNSPSLLGYTPIVFDDDGSLLDAFLGDGAGSNVLGIAGPITVSSGPLVNEIAESQAIFNGRFVNGIDTFSDPESDDSTFKGTIIHEIGHGLGFDHAQINVEAIKPGASKEIKESVPLLFPVAVNNLFDIRLDDASSAALLYPNLSELGRVGRIEGKVFRSDGKTPVQGANVIARNVNNPLLEAVSCVSDYLVRNTGEYSLFALPPGDYRLELEPIDLSFTGGSGVGPFTESKSDKSFQNPVPKGFYVGPDLPITDDQNQALIIMIQAGQILKDQNIIASKALSSTSSTSSSSGGGTVTEIEPNDSVSEAQPVQLPVKIQGNASSADDGEIELSSDTGSSVVISDLFQFTLSSTAHISGLLTIESDVKENDLDLVLLDEFATNIIEASSQTGNTDELVSQTLQPGTYLIGVGAFSGSAAYTLNITVLSEDGPPSIAVSGPEALILKQKGKNMIELSVNSFNFNTRTRCEVITSDNVAVMVKPSVFKLDKTKPKRKVKIKIPLSQALTLIEEDRTETLSISILCDNGVSDEIDVEISPTLNPDFVFRKYTDLHRRR